MFPSMARRFLTRWYRSLATMRSSKGTSNSPQGAASLACSRNSCVTGICETLRVFTLAPLQSATTFAFACLQPFPNANT
eukprot:1526039-Alexandrium_andersonii.AAC.1